MEFVSNETIQQATDAVVLEVSQLLIVKNEQAYKALAK